MEATYLANVKDLGEVVEVCSNFAAELKQLRSAGAVLITPEQEALARLQTNGKENVGKVNGTWTSMGVEYIKGENPILRRQSRLLSQKQAKLAIEANRNNNYFLTNSTREYEQSAKQAKQDENIEPERRRAIVLPSREVFSMDRNNNYECLDFILGKMTNPYLKLQNQITFYPVDKQTVDAQKGTLLTQLWFRSLDVGSVLGGTRDLDCSGRARGVRVASATTAENFHEAKNNNSSGSLKEAGSQNSRVLPYTQKQLEQNLRIATGVRNGTLPASRLEKVTEFLNKLKK